MVAGGSTSLAVSLDGIHFRWLGTAFDVGRGWDRYQARLSCVARVAGGFVGLYDGAASADKDTALLRTYAVPAIGRLLASTGELTERTQRRYDDTDLMERALRLATARAGRARGDLRLLARDRPADGHPWDPGELRGVPGVQP